MPYKAPIIFDANSYIIPPAPSFPILGDNGNSNDAGQYVAPPVFTPPPIPPVTVTPEPPQPPTPEPPPEPPTPAPSPNVAAQAPETGPQGVPANSTISPAPQPKPSGDLRAMARASAQAQGLDPDLFERLIQAESSFNPGSVSPVGAQGLGQLMPATARSLGVTNAFDPKQNLDASARYLKQQIDYFGGDVRKGLAAYNAGAGNIEKGIYPQETIAYVNKILGDGSNPPPPPPPPPTPPGGVGGGGQSGQLAGGTPLPDVASLIAGGLAAGDENTGLALTPEAAAALPWGSIAANAALGGAFGFRGGLTGALGGAATGAFIGQFPEQTAALGDYLGSFNVPFTDQTVKQTLTNISNVEHVVGGMLATLEDLGSAIGSDNGEEYQAALHNLVQQFKTAGFDPVAFFRQVHDTQPGSPAAMAIDTLADPGNLLLLALTGGAGNIISAAREVAGPAAGLVSTALRVRSAVVMEAIGRGLPPVPDGHVRLFRGEGVRPGEETAGWQPPDQFHPAAIFASLEKNQPDYMGRYFSPDRSVAESFRNPYLNYVDVPAEVVRQNQRLDQFTGKPADVILPAEYVAQRKAVPPNVVIRAVQALGRGIGSLAPEGELLGPGTRAPEVPGYKSATLGMSVGAPPPGEGESQLPDAWQKLLGRLREEAGAGKAQEQPEFKAAPLPPGWESWRSAAGEPGPGGIPQQGMPPAVPGIPGPAALPAGTPAFPVVEPVRPPRVGTEGVADQPVKFGETILESPNASEALKAKIASEPIMDTGPRNTAALEQAAYERYIADPLRTENRLLASASRGGSQRSFTDENVAEAIVAVRSLTGDGATPEEIQRGADLADVVARQLREAGRTVQAATIQNAMSEGGQLVKLANAKEQAIEQSGIKPTEEALARTTERTLREQADNSTKQLDETIQNLKEAGQTAEKAAQNPTKKPPETPRSKSIRSALEKAINFVADSGRAPIKPGDASEEAQILSRFKLLSQETGYTLQEEEFQSLIDDVNAAKAMPPAERKVAMTDIVHDIRDNYLPLLEERSNNYHQSRALIKKASEAVDYISSRGRLPRQMAPEGTPESAIVRDIKKYYDRLGENLPEELQKSLGDALDTIKGMDVGSVERIQEAQGFIRDTLGPIRDQMKEVVDYADRTAALVKKAGSTVEELANAGRNPKQMNITDEQAKKLDVMRRNANRIGYLLPENLRTELASWLDTIKGLREGSQAKETLIREYINRLTTGDIARAIDEGVKTFKTDAERVKWEEAQYKYMADVAERITKPKIQDDLKDTMTKVRATLRETGAAVPQELATSIVERTRTARDLQTQADATTNPAERRDLLAQRYRLLGSIAYDIQGVVPAGKWSALETIYELPRGLVAGFDYSSLLRQGRYAMAAHPQVWAQAAATGARAAMSENAALQAEAYRRTRPLAAFWDRAGLYEASLPGRGMGTAATQEEKFAGLGNVVFENPAARGVQAVSDAAQRAYVTQLNEIRTHIADNLYNKYQSRGVPMTEEEAQAYAAAVNVMTGRGRFPTQALNQAAPFLARLFFSPRSIAARAERYINLARAAETVALGPSVAGHRIPGTFPSRRIGYEIGKDLAAWYGVLGTFMGAAALSGFKVGFNPTLPNFGSVEANGVEYNFAGDDAALMRSLAKLATGTERTRQGGSYPINPGNVLRDYLSNQVAPQLGIAWNQITGSDYLGRSLGTPAQRLGNVVGGMQPGVVQGFTDALKNDRGLGSALGSAAAQFAGINANAATSLTEQRDKTSMELTGRKYGDLPYRSTTSGTVSQETVDATPKVKSILDDIKGNPAPLEARDAIAAARESFDAESKRLEAALKPALDRNGYQLTPDMSKELQNYRDGRFEAAKTAYHPAIQELLKNGKGEQTPLELLREQYWDSDIPLDPVTQEPDYRERDRRRADTLKAAVMQGFKPEDVTTKKAASDDPRVQALLDQFDAAKDAVRPYYDVPTNLQEQFPALKGLVQMHDQYAREANTVMGQARLRAFEQTDAWNTYDTAVQNLRTALRARNPEVHQAGVALGRWSPILPKLR